MKHIVVGNLWINTEHLLTARYSEAGVTEEEGPYTSSLTLVFDVKLFTISNPHCGPDEGMYKLVLRGDQADCVWESLGGEIPQKSKDVELREEGQLWLKTNLPKE